LCPYKLKEQQSHWGSALMLGMSSAVK